MDPIVGSGKYTYKVHEDWAHPPEGLEVRACAVSVDSKDRVPSRLPIVMRVNIDPAGRDQQTVGGDSAPRWS